MRRQRRSITDIICENCKYLPTKRSRNKRKPIPKESDVKTFKKKKLHGSPVGYPVAKTSCEENKVIDAMIYSGLYSSRASKIWRRD
ncbi:NinE protein [Escherichia coli SHECO003]|nr:NinE protein [Escherichia coli SHECO003]